MAALPASKRGKSSQIVKLTVQPGGTAVGRATGSFLYVVAAPGAFKLRIDQESFVDATEGSSIEVTQDEAFESFEVLNNQAFPITIKVFVGFAKYNRQSVALLEQATEAAGKGITSLAANTGQTISPDLSGLRILRRSITISNLDAASNVYLRDTSGNVIGVIFPQTAQVYFVSGDVEVYNPNPGAINVFVGEIYYVRES